MGDQVGVEATSQASSQVRTFFFSSSLRCSTCSPQQCSSARHLAFLMMIYTGSITEWMLSMYSFSSSLSMSGLPSRQSTILVHFSVIQAETTSVFSWTTRPRRVSSWMSPSHCVSSSLFLSASRIISPKQLSSSTMRSLFFSLRGSKARFGHSVFRTACGSSQGRLHQQQNSHWHKHFICEHPTFFSMGSLHLGHSRVLLRIQLELVSSELRRLYHRLTSSQAMGKWGWLRQRQQQSCPQGQATVFISIMLGFTQKQGHLSLGQQQMSLFRTAQLTHVFFRFSSDTSGATASTNPRSTGARAQGTTYMQVGQMRPDWSSWRRQPVQQLAQQACGQRPVEQSGAWVRQTGQGAASWSRWASAAQSRCAWVRADQSSEKYWSVSFSSFHWQCWSMQRQRSWSSMLSVLCIWLALTIISAQSSSSRTNLASNCSLFCSYMLNSLVLLALEQVQRSCSSESSEILRLRQSFGTPSSSSARTGSYQSIQKITSKTYTPLHYSHSRPAIYDHFTTHHPSSSITRKRTIRGFSDEPALARCAFEGEERQMHFGGRGGVVGWERAAIKK